MPDDPRRWPRRAAGFRLVAAGLVALGFGLMVATVLGLDSIVMRPGAVRLLIALDLVRPWELPLVESLLMLPVALLIVGKGACLLAGLSGRVARLVELSITLDATALVIHALGWRSDLGALAPIGPACVVEALMMFVQAVGFLARAEGADRQARRIARSGSALGLAIALGLLGFAIAPIAAIGGGVALILGAFHGIEAGRWAAGKADPKAKSGID